MAPAILSCALAILAFTGCSRGNTQGAVRSKSQNPELIQLVGPVDEMDVPDDLVDVTRRALTTLLSADAGIYTVHPESFQVPPGPYAELSTKRMTDIGRSETVGVYLRQSGTRGLSISVYCDADTGQVQKIVAPVH